MSTDGRTDGQTDEPITIVPSTDVGGQLICLFSYLVT